MTYDLKKIQVKCAELIGWKWHGEEEWDHESKSFYWKHKASGVAYSRLPNFHESADAASSRNIKNQRNHE